LPTYCQDGEDLKTSKIKMGEDSMLTGIYTLVEEVVGGI
jgi:hypothetical protein